MSHDTPAVSSRSPKMGWESNSLHSGKRMRPAEDEVYLDNYHVQKRYLSEVMASRLNGLKVGDSLSESVRISPQTFDPMESPVRTETGGLSRSLSSFPSNGEELSTLDSSMSDDSDESICYRLGRYSETPQRISVSHSELTRPSSPRKAHKSSTCSGSQSVGISCNGILPCSSGLSSTPSLPLPCSQSRQRATDTESRFPPSPSDPCHSADLRRAALLRSLQMRAQSPVAASYAVAADDCIDPCMHSLAESEDQCSPSSLTFGESTAELTEYNDDVLGSPVHGIFPSQVGRGSSRARSLLLDECASVVPATMDDALSSALDISSLNTGMPQEDSVHGGGMNDDGSFSSPYIEEVSESSDKVGDVSHIDAVLSTRFVL